MTTFHISIESYSDDTNKCHKTHQAVQLARQHGAQLGKSDPNDIHLNYDNLTVHVPHVHLEFLRVLSHAVA